jgi:hypothetical protein
MTIAQTLEARIRDLVSLLLPLDDELLSLDRDLSMARIAQTLEARIGDSASLFSPLNDELLSDLDGDLLMETIAQLCIMLW